MASHLEPPPPDYRKRYSGTMLLEMHALAGSWDEFAAMLELDITYPKAVLEWFCAPGEVDHDIYERAHELARAALSR